MTPEEKRALEEKAERIGIWWEGHNEGARKQLAKYVLAALNEATAALREENERLRWVVKGAHGALTDAETVVVPGVLDGDIAPAIRQLTRERDEEREAVVVLTQERNRLEREREEARAKLAKVVAWCEAAPDQWVMRKDVLYVIAAANGEVGCGCPVPDCHHHRGLAAKGE